MEMIFVFVPCGEKRGDDGLTRTIQDDFSVWTHLSKARNKVVHDETSLRSNYETAEGLIELSRTEITPMSYPNRKPMDRTLKGLVSWLLKDPNNTYKLHLQAIACYPPPKQI